MPLANWSPANRSKTISLGVTHSSMELEIHFCWSGCSDLVDWDVTTQFVSHFVCQYCAKVPKRLFKASEYPQPTRATKYRTWKRPRSRDKGLFDLTLMCNANLTRRRSDGTSCQWLLLGLTPRTIWHEITTIACTPAHTEFFIWTHKWLHYSLGVLPIVKGASALGTGCGPDSAPVVQCPPCMASIWNVRFSPIPLWFDDSWIITNDMAPELRIPAGALTCDIFYCAIGVIIITSLPLPLVNCRIRFG